MFNQEVPFMGASTIFKNMAHMYISEQKISLKDFVITYFELESLEDWNGNTFWMGEFKSEKPQFTHQDCFIIYDQDGDCIRFQHDYPDNILDELINLVKEKIRLLLRK